MSAHTSDNLCYCTPSPGTESRLGHIHGAKLTAEQWATGIMAIATLAGSSRMPHLSGLPKAVKKAQRILLKKVECNR
jgi:hypothetical protein